MGSLKSRPGRRRRSRRPNGWGVEVRVPGRRIWQLLMKPGQDAPLVTTLAGARAWAVNWESRGLKVRLVEIKLPRGSTFRPRLRVEPRGPQPRVVTHQLPLFSGDGRDSVP